MESVFVRAVRERLPQILYKRIPLSAYCSIGCGGLGDIFYPRREDELISLLRICHRENIRYFFLSGGSNVLLPDFFGGIYISFRAFRGLNFQNGTLCVYSGEKFSSLIRFSRENNLSFCEFLYGIPALVGGGVYMNAGVGRKHFSDIVKCVYATDGDEIYTFSSSECAFGEKSSIFQFNHLAIIKAEFYYEKAESEIIGEKTDLYREKRKSLPKGKSVGCVFKNGDIPSGALIDGCGLKGIRIGGASISGQHANFIINDNGASFRDIISLIAYVQETVRRQTGINLVKEIQILS